MLFDRKVGKIVARYQQFFGIRALLARISQKKPESQGGGREGGVVWHTTGSGKSFTMVFLTKALLLVDALKECRVVVVTDRIDLETQLARNFMTGGAFGSSIATQKDGEKSRTLSGVTWPSASARARSASPSRSCTSSTQPPSCRSAATTQPT